MKHKIDKNGATGAKPMIALIAILAGALLLTSGVLTFSLPTAQDKYSEIVNRNATDIGIKIPIEIRLDFTQVTNTGANKANVDVNIKHQHASGSDYVPDAVLISKTNFNTQVANVGDTSTVYAVNGNDFMASDIAFNSTLKSIPNVEFGYAQNNYKVWTKSSTHTPSTTDSNHVIVIQAQFDHYRKATKQLLNSHVVTFGVYYKMPDYNEEDSYVSSFTYYIYVPFDDYALIEDIECDIRGYQDSCIIQWKTISATARQFWALEIFGITVFKVVKQVETTISTNLIYSWQNPKAYSINNDNQYGSHSYTYKIR